LETKKSTLFGALALACALYGGGCSGKNDSPSTQTEQNTSAPLLSTVAMSNTQAESQLVRGFYGIENGWRWTAGHFTALLKTPPDAAKTGATLSFNFSIPEGVIQKIDSIALTASINGMPLKSETYSKTGNYVYTADVPASMLTGATVKVDFALDKTLPPGPVDKRELGVVAQSVGIAGK
jgi:hypothetical protein